MLQLAKTNANNVDEWRYADRSNKEEVVYKISAFSHFERNACSPNILLDLAAFVHVFNKNEMFSNFKRALKGQGFLCGNDIITIKWWSQISLSLKVKGWIKLLTLNNVAYILNFSLNLVFLGCLQKRGYDWLLRSGELLKNSQIIEYTQFRGNNYEIGDIETKMVFATYAVDSALVNTAKSSQSY